MEFGSCHNVKAIKGLVIKHIMETLKRYDFDVLLRGVVGRKGKYAPHDGISTGLPLPLEVID